MVRWKDSSDLICWPYAVSFGIQIKSNYLIRFVVEVQFLGFMRFFFQRRIAFFTYGGSNWPIIAICTCETSTSTIIRCSWLDNDYVQMLLTPFLTRVKEVDFCEGKVTDLEETKRCTGLESADGARPMARGIFCEDADPPALVLSRWRVADEVK